MEIILRHLKTSRLHILRNLRLSIASILIMALTFFISSVFLVAWFGADTVLNYFQHQSQLIVFFNPDTVTNSEVINLENGIKAQKVPVNITYISKQEAYNRFIGFLRSDSPGLTQSVDASKLPPSIEVKTDTISDLQVIANYVSKETLIKSNSIDKVLYYKDVEEFLKEFINLIQICAIVFSIFLSSVSLLIVWITIGINLSTHADEIEIMQLVGATSRYVEIPYIIEGAVYGMLGALLSEILIFVLYLMLLKVNTASYLVFVSYFKGIPLPKISVTKIIYVVVIELGIGSFIGALGSLIAVKRRLN